MAEAGAATEPQQYAPVEDHIRRDLDTPRFSFADPAERAAGLAFLAEHGYVVAANVATADQLEHAKDLLWQFLEREIDEGIQRGKPSTWSDPEWPAKKSTGIVFGNSAGHSEMMWFLRGLDAVQQVYREIWQDDDLISSFDRFGLFRPWGTRDDWRTQGGWWHVDQNTVKRPGKQCVQGFVSLFDGTAMSGGLAVVEGSWKAAENIAKRNNIKKTRGDFVRMKPREPVVEKGVKKLVKYRAGDLVLWDSRTIHCNCPGVEELRDQQPTDDLLRCVAYICMTPRKLATPEILALRQRYARTHLTTGHWPHTNFSEIDERKPVGYKRKLHFTLTDEQKRLI